MAEEDSSPDETSNESFLTQLNDLFIDAIASAADKLSDPERKKLEALSDEDMDEILDKSMKGVSSFYLQSFNTHSNKQYYKNKKHQKSFEERLVKSHEPYLIELYGIISICTDAISFHRDYIHSERLIKSKREREHYGVLIRLHARALRICNEIKVLIRTGYGTGALSRWRSLHETATIINFLVTNPDATNLFLEHNKVLSCKAMSDYNMYASELNATPFTKREIATSKRVFVNVINKYGSDFEHDYGWLRVYTNRRMNHFRDLEEHYGQKHLRPYYRYASYGIHANSKSLLSGEESDALDMEGILLIGPSDDGLDDVAQLTPISISYATVTILTGVHVNIGSLVMAKVIMHKQSNLLRTFRVDEKVD